MARYEHLPIYKKAMELSVYLEGTVMNFSRYHKYAIGSELRQHSRQILRLIIEANSARSEREDILYQLARHCDMLATMLALAKETRAFAGFKSFQQAAVLTVTLCKQSEGWLKSSRESRNRQPPAARG